MQRVGCEGKTTRDEIRETASSIRDCEPRKSKDPEAATNVVKDRRS